MSFRKFESDAEVIAFARQNSPIFSSEARLHVDEIGDGNINFVYRVADGAGNSLIIKQALPYVRIIGESWPLSQDRIRIEAEALRMAGEHCADLVPQVYHFDAALCAIVMEDIGSHDNLRHALIARRRLPLLAEHLGRFLADTLFFSSDLYLDAHRKKALVKSFINPDLCKISEDLFFVDPYCDHERNAINAPLRADAEALWNDDLLKLEVAKLKAKFLNQAEALLHGDLHSGSVFANETGTKVIDPEFAYFGPIGFDVGSILGNYLLNFAGQANLPGDASERRDYQQWLLDGMATLWQTFESRFRQHMAEQTNDPSLQLPQYADWYLGQLLADSLGYAGTELIRRTIGLAHVADMESITDPAQRAESERLALQLGRTLIVEREQLADMEAVIQRVKALAG
ncbi:S-methyl-5-thioribose kinase [Marinobacterium arenosum]|uniref:S-methyl-5-thioribose kinase n=1 Tax=Marinobacterium arenosum TaxID=2862496 RepID=UPI001C9571A3|nr:S-methyl-5-thioribose kinase [Marinobacterium arenosum]MBY4678942.1 S-methyl-5-thioribose kinase [Marinobacterium arenosum]